MNTAGAKYDVTRYYEIVDSCGGGYYGQVLKAKCRETSEECAIKLVPVYQDEKEKYNRRELEALLKLNLSKESKLNIIQYFKSRLVLFNSKNTLCIQMELCWKDLKTFVYENRQFAPQTTHAQDSLRFYHHVFKQVLNGLISIHSIGWVHRDIHPGNILIVNPNPQHISDIHVKIADFGLARHIGKIPTGAKVSFTVSNGSTVHPEIEQPSPAKGGFHAAPELLLGEYNHKVDV